MYWRLHKSIFKDRIEEAEEILKMAGDEVQIVEGTQHSLPPPHLSALTQPALAITTLQDMRFVVNKSQACPWSYFSENKFKVSYWLPRLIQENLPVLNSGGVFLPFGMIQHTSQITNASTLFIKPDSGNKLFTGQVVNIPQDLNYIHVEPETMCFVSSAVKIDPIEWRLWFVDRKLVSYSPYSWDASLDLSLTTLPKEVAAIASGITKMGWQPDVSFVVDVVGEPIIGSTKRVFTINEINSTSTSGVYAAPLEPLFNALREAACREFESSF